MQIRKSFRALRRRSLVVGFGLAFLLPRIAAASDVPGVYDPVADPRAVIIAGHARFTVLTPQLIRMEWATDGKFEDHASLVFLNRKLPVPQFTHESQQGGGVEIKTSALNLLYAPGNGDGKFTADTLSISLSLDGREIVWKPGTPDTGNLLGTTRTLDGVQGTNVKLEPGLISRDGWTVVDDSSRPLFDHANFSFLQGENGTWPWVELRLSGDRLDWYFFGYGHDYKKALSDYTLVAGKIPLPPRFAFGAWWSRYWAYTDQQFEELIQGFHHHETPLDVLVIDMDWHITGDQLGDIKKPDASGHRLGWTGYTWNKLLFPDPGQFLADVHKQGLKTTMNIHPASGVQPWEEQYPEMARSVGINPASKQFVPFDITDKKFATNYMNIMIHPQEREGIDFFWLDWQQEQTTAIAGLNPTWWLNYVFFSDQEREGKRPLLFHRWGGLGNHRYQIGFSGDAISVWDSLSFQPYFTATAANVGYAYWSHDIGGHMPGAIEPELYLRWIQWGTFSPILRTHTTKNPDAERRIWAYPEPYAGLMRQSYVRRYALQPYIYTEARNTYDTGLAFLHPLYYDWPEAPQAYDAKNEYMFGDSILADPITQPVAKESQLATTQVWLPAGDWIEWETGARFHGPVSVERNFSLPQVPLYVKAGSIIPMQPPMSHTGELPVDPLILTVLPLEDGQVSKFRLYDDAGDTAGYKSGECTWTPIEATANGDGTSVTVTISPTTGHYQGMPTARAYQLRFPANWPPTAVSVNGEPLAYSRDGGKPGWKFEGDTLTTVITTRRYSMTEAVAIKIRIAPHSASDRALVYGFAGKITRLRETFDILNAAWPAGSSPNSLIDAMQTGDRLNYRPETALAELKALSQKIPTLSQAVESMHATENSPAFAALSNDKQAQSRKLEQYNAAVDLAIAHMKDLATTAAGSPAEAIQPGKQTPADVHNGDSDHSSSKQ